MLKINRFNLWTWDWLGGNSKKMINYRCMSKCCRICAQAECTKVLVDHECQKIMMAPLNQ